MDMSKLSTMIRDAQTVMPHSSERVLVWDSRILAWTIAYYTSEHKFEEWQRGNFRVVVDGRWWVPLPEEPEEDR